MVAFNNGLKFGFLNWSMGVGTVIIKQFELFISSTLLVKFKRFKFFSSCLLNSKFLSFPDFNSLIRSLLISKPMIDFFLANSKARGRPT